jgi:hypothetical protein
MQVHY